MRGILAEWKSGRLTLISLAAVFGFGAPNNASVGSSHRPPTPGPQYNFTDDELFDFSAYTGLAEL
jgi:hypothetical protein